MKRDTARVVLITATVAGLFGSSLIGVAEESAGVRLPAAPGNQAVQRSYEMVTVEPGDHFWKISERKLDDSGANSPVGPYWRRVVAANLDNIRSGNPDLIYPGELVELPAP